MVGQEQQRYDALLHNWSLIFSICLLSLLLARGWCVTSVNTFDLTRIYGISFSVVVVVRHSTSARGAAAMGFFELVALAGDGQRFLIISYDAVSPGFWLPLYFAHAGSVLTMISC